MTETNENEAGAREELDPHALDKACSAWLEHASDYRRLRESIAAAITAYLAASRLKDARGDAVAWRCFHCDEVFTDEQLAREHFGIDDSRTPACVIKAGAEGSLVKALRMAEDAAAEAIHKMQDESAEGYRLLYGAQARFRTAIQAAEEAGYEKGLTDGRASPPSPPVVGMEGVGEPDIADDNDGKEQDAFEAWAKSEKFDMSLHPLLWLFLDPSTNAARRGWRAGICYARDRVRAALSSEQKL